MLSHPRPGQRVELRYRAETRPVFPWHGAAGVVVTPSHGHPRNHLVRLDCGFLMIVPAGNLVKEVKHA